MRKIEITIPTASELKQKVTNHFQEHRAKYAAGAGLVVGGIVMNAFDKQTVKTALHVDSPAPYVFANDAFIERLHEDGSLTLPSMDGTKPEITITMNTEIQEEN